jgi:hypothetical protein
MTRLDILKEREKELKLDLSKISIEINEIVLADGLAKSEFKVGDRCLHYGKEYEITRAKIYFNRVMFLGKKVLKDGSLGKVEFEMYGKLEKVGGAQ